MREKSGMVVVVNLASFLGGNIQCLFFFFKGSALEQKGGVVGMSEVVELNI